jgi:tetratricopeptide (TPR) repeat protein
MVALQAAKRSEDALALTGASRGVAALSLRKLAELRLTAGEAADAVDMLRRSIDFEDVSDSRVHLGSAYLLAGKIDDALSQATNVVVTDPQNADAWRLQGQIWLLKKNFSRAVEPLKRSAELQPDAYTEYLLGCALLESGDVDRAQASFQRMLARGRGNRAVLYALVSDAFLNANLLDDAARKLKQAQVFDAKSSRAHYRLAILESARKEWAITPAVRAELIKEVEVNPRDFDGNYALGLTEFFAQHYSQSAALLRVAHTARPDWPEPWLYLGLGGYSARELKSAEQDLRKAIALTTDESRGGYQIRRAYYTLGRLLTEQDRGSEGTAFLRRFRDIQSRMLADTQQTPGTMDSGMAQVSMSAAAFRALARVQMEALFALRGTLESSLDLGFPLYGFPLTTAQQESTKRQELGLGKILSGALNDLGAVEARQEQFALALNHFHEAEKWSAETGGLMRNIGMAAARLSNYPESVRALRPVVNANPRDTVARSMLGLGLFATEAYGEAAEVLTPLGDSVLERPELAYALASSLVKLNQYPKASALLTKLNERQLPPETLIVIAQTWSQMGNYPETVEICHQALASDPKLRRAHYIAGLALIHQDHPAQAADEFRSELLLDADSIDAQFHLAFTLLQLSQNEEATHWLRSVLARNPEHPEANYELGKELMGEAKSADAVPYLEAAARLKPQFEPVHYQLQSAYRALGRKEDADREATIYRELKAKSRNITLPPPRQESSQSDKPQP